MWIDRMKSRLKYMLYAVYLSCGLIALMAATDISFDLKYHAPWLHIFVELVLLLTCILSTLWLIRGISRFSQRSIDQLATEIDHSQGQLHSLQQAHDSVLQGLALRISAQFDAWQLTHSEREIGLLLIKGLAMKEIAEVRGTSERTIREQSRKIYQKAQLSGRSSLAAYFLEDLLLPHAQQERVPDS